MAEPSQPKEPLTIKAANLSNKSMDKLHKMVARINKEYKEKKGGAG